MTTPPAILWLRRDLRLHDLPALGAAHDAGGAVLPVFVLDPTLLASAGDVRTACLVDALRALEEPYDGAVVVRSGRPEEVLPALAAEVGATSVHVSAEPSPYGRRRDAHVGAALAGAGVDLVATGSPYAVTPGRVLKDDGDPYRVFTPFSRAWRRHGWRAPATTPSVRWHRGPDSEPLPSPDLTDDVALPAVGEAAAHERWRAFLDDALEDYAEGRDRPAVDGTSQLSVQLKYGTVHPRTLLADVAAHRAARSRGAETFVTELCWREFYADVLWHRPDAAWADLRPTALTYAPLAWPDAPGAGRSRGASSGAGRSGRGPARPYAADATDEALARERFDAWREGRTGFPFVDAGMRQLRHEGWMHNRVRMVTASFLVKDLHVWWGHGARVFLDHLRDGDMASNSQGWQWVAGTGTDAAPYFRVFNPVSQGRKFDPDGAYVRRYVPELAHVEGGAAHEPWLVDDGLAHGYPERVVDHAAERAEALRRYEASRG
ncbi:cryptochrome/photolyase family protein [Actinotalea solisilvae]|uniref:cryptochrome/photolyase family protein n=1 Tax=Actinotalea solisilvae TaxID=2072922 RepID=UPI0018F26166|nr:deoxyribodipyrimidine photo-lyase [Actinotalea solisilvae]